MSVSTAINPDSQKVKPAWLVSALENTEQIHLIKTPCSKLSGQRQGATDAYPQPGCILEQSTNVSLTDFSAILSASIERNHGEMLAAKEKDKADTSQMQECIDKRMTDLSSIVYGLASADHQQQSSPLHRVPGTLYQTLAPSPVIHRPVTAPRRQVKVTAEVVRPFENTVEDIH